MEIKDLISKKYLQQNKQMHEEGEWGISGHRHAKIIHSAIKILGITDILDYGCGRGTLKQALKKDRLEVHEYDPAVPGKDTLPSHTFDLITCTDVLEHVEPEYIDAVLSHMVSLCGGYAYFVISIKPAQKRLPDGRNAHILLKDEDWWRDKITEHGWKIMGYEVKRDSHKSKKEIRTWLRIP